MREDIRFYCGVGEKTFNHHPVFTGPYACISPVCGRGGIDKQGKQRKQKINGVRVGDECREIILDSGAFSDTTYHRCDFDEALARQLNHAKRFEYMDKLSHIASYDVLIDEQDRGDGTRVKERWNVDLADFAVEKTVQAAEYLVSKRAYIEDQVGHPVGLVLSAQGVDTAQYIRCAERILPLLNPEKDIFGLGGWCILGMRHKLLPTFFETMSELLPLLKSYQIKRAHIWGVCFAEALGPLSWLCDHDRRGSWDEKHRVELSTDSVGPTTRMLKELSGKPGRAAWGYASWYDSSYPVPRIFDTCKVVGEQERKAPTCAPGTPCRGLERARHVAATREWLADFRRREPAYYHAPLLEQQEAYQPSLFDCPSEEVENYEHATNIA